MRIQFAFQGGGARLVPLIAAVEGILDAAPRDTVEITNASGASAGAIAAAMLCSGVNPRVFRDRIRQNGAAFERRIVRPLSKYNPRMYLRMLAGEPIYNHLAYRDFLNDLFRDEQGHGIIAMPAAPGLWICQSSLESGVVPHRFGGGSSSLVNELVKSSAIPFVFHGHSIPYPEVDGGMLNNLPLDMLPVDGGYRIGITFKEKARATPRSADTYAMALVSCVIEASVMRGRLEDGVHLVPIATGIDTFEFKKAVEFADTFEYDTLKEAVSARVKAILATLEIERNTESVPASTKQELEALREYYISEIGGMLGKVQVIHDGLRRNVQLKVPQKLVEYRCYNLLDGQTTGRKDLCSVKETIVPSAPIMAYGASLTTADVPTPSEHLNFNVEGADRVQRAATQVALPSYYRSPVSQSLCNVMLFFSPPLDPAEGPFKVEWRNETEEVLFDLLAPSAEDFVMHACKEAEVIEELYIICQIPSRYRGEVCLADDPRFKSADATWVAGTIMSERQLASLDLPLAESGMFRVGWYVKNLVQGNECGFRAFLKAAD